MDNKKYSIVLGGKIDAASVSDSIRSLEQQGKLPKISLKVRLEIDESEINSIRSKIDGVFRESLSRQASKITGTTASGTTSASSTPLSGDIASITTKYNKEGSVTGMAVKRMEDLNNEYTEYINKNGEVTRSTSKTTTALKENLQNVKRADEWYGKVSGRIKDLSDNNIISAKSAESFSAKLEELNKIEDPQQRLKGFKQLNQEISDSKKQVMGFGEMVKTALEKFSIWSIVTVGWYKAVEMLKDTVVQVKAIDDALVELNKVADLSDSQMESLTQRAFNLADSVAQVGSEAINAITEVKRAGFSLEESELIAKYALMMTNVAEGITDAGDAANVLISVLKGTNAPISYASQLLDEMNEISNNSAISFDALANMTQEIAGTMSTLGASTEETMSMITGAYEVLQDERVAKGISVIGLRINGLNESLEEEAGLQSNINEALMKYAKISIFDEQTGQLRNYYNVMEDLHEVWGGLTKNAQTYLTTELAGKNRADVLTALMNNWSGVEKAMSQAENSAGSALKEQESYLNSIEGHLKRLQNAWQQLATQSLESDTVKFVIELGTLIANLSKNLGGILNTATLITGIVLTLQGFSLGARLKNLSIEMGFLSSATTTATVSVSTFKVALGGVLSVLGLVITAVNLYKQSVAEAEAKRQEDIQTATESIDKIKTEIQEYRDLSLELEKLKSRRDALNKSEEQTAEIRERIAKLNAQIAEQESKLGNADVEKNWQRILEEYRKLESLKKEELEKSTSTLLEGGRYETGVGTAVTQSVGDWLRENAEGVYTRQVTHGKYSLVTTGETPEEWLSNLRKTYDKLISSAEYEIDPTLRDFAVYINNAIVQLDGLIESNQQLQEEYEKMSSMRMFLEADGSKAIDALMTSYEQFTNATYDQKEAMLEENGELAKNLEAVEQMKAKYPEAASEIEGFVSGITEAINSLKNQDRIFDVVNKFKESIAAEKESYESLQETESKELELQEKLLAVEEARLKLAESRRKQVRVYRAGQGMTYMDDLQSAAEAEKTLLKAEKELEKYRSQESLSESERLAENVASRYDELTTIYGAEQMRQWFKGVSGSYTNGIAEAGLRDLLNRMNAFTGLDSYTDTSIPSGRPENYRTGGLTSNKGSSTFAGYESPIGPPAPASLPQLSEKQKYLLELMQKSGRVYNINNMNVTADDAEEFAKSLDEAARNGGK